MSFNAREIVRFFGKPVELYRFTRQTLHWRYTSADTAITVGAETFEPLAVSRTAIAESYESQRRQITITLPIGAAVLDNWAVMSPEDPITVTLLAGHRGEAEVAVHWVGRVLQPRFTDSSCELICQPGAGSVRPRGRQLRFQRGCPLALYSQGPGMCTLDPVDFAEPVELEDVDGVTLTAAAWAALPAGRLAGGYVEWTAASGLVHRRSITSHVGDSINLDYSAPDLEVGLEVTAYHGCAHTYADCDSKGNGPNFGGCTQLPTKDPFAGNPIWW